MEITLKENAHSYASVKESVTSFFGAKEDFKYWDFFFLQSPQKLRDFFLIYFEVEQGAPTKALAPFPQS